MMQSFLFPIEEEILNTLKQKKLELNNNNVINDGAWTEAFKETLISLGRDKKFQVWGTSESGADFNEWMWDITWARVGRDPKNENQDDWTDFRGIYLAAEIEWSRNEKELLYDFLKLVVAKADYRLFIFCLKKKDQAFEKFKTLMAACPASQGARYFTIAVPYYTKEDFKYEAWTL